MCYKFIYFFLITLFVTFQSAAQSHLPFTEKQKINEEITTEIERVMAAFNRSNVSMNLNRWRLDTLNSEDINVFWKKDHLFAVQFPLDSGQSNKRTTYFDKNSSIRLIVDQFVSDEGLEEYYTYFGEQKTMHFLFKSPINYIQNKVQNTRKIQLLGDSLKIIQNEKRPSLPGVKEKNALQKLGVNYFHSCFEMLPKLKGKYVFHGEMGMKVNFNMEWKVKRNGKIKGEILYLSDNQEQIIKGRLTEQHFSLQITNDNHAAEGRVIGRIIDSETFRGQLFLDGAEKGDTFIMHIVNGKK